MRQREYAVFLVVAAVLVVAGWLAGSGNTVSAQGAPTRDCHFALFGEGSHLSAHLPRWGATLSSSSLVMSGRPISGRSDHLAHTSAAPSAQGILDSAL